MRRLIEPSHLDLCCLQKPIIIACGSERVKSSASGEEGKYSHIRHNFLEAASIPVARELGLPKPQCACTQPYLNLRYSHVRKQVLS